MNGYQQEGVGWMDMTIHKGDEDGDDDDDDSEGIHC